MTDPYGGASASASLSSSSNSSSNDTDDDQAIARILAGEENHKNHGKLGKMLSHLDSIPIKEGAVADRYCNCGRGDESLSRNEIWELFSRAAGKTNGLLRLATYDLAELQMEGDGNCQFRALADQLFHNPEYHKHVRKQVVKQLKKHRRLYEGYVPMKYKSYLKMMKRLGEWGDHLTLQAAADRFSAKICLLTSFRDTYYIEIIPKDTDPSRELWLSFWSEVHYNSLYERGAVPARTPKKKHWYSLTSYG